MRSPGSAIQQTNHLCKRLSFYLIPADNSPQRILTRLLLPPLNLTCQPSGPPVQEGTDAADRFPRVETKAGELYVTHKPCFSAGPAFPSLSHRPLTLPSTCHRTKARIPSISSDLQPPSTFHSSAAIIDILLLPFPPPAPTRSNHVHSANGETKARSLDEVPWSDPPSRTSCLFPWKGDPAPRSRRARAGPGQTPASPCGARGGRHVGCAWGQRRAVPSKGHGPPKEAPATTRGSQLVPRRVPRAPGPLRPPYCARSLHGDPRTLAATHKKRYPASSRRAQRLLCRKSRPLEAACPLAFGPALNKIHFLVGSGFTNLLQSRLS